MQKRYKERREKQKGRKGERTRLVEKGRELVSGEAHGQTSKFTHSLNETRTNYYNLSILRVDILKCILQKQFVISLCVISGD